MALLSCLTLMALFIVLGDIARAQGMSNIAKSSGLSRESLYKSLSGERAPDFATVLKVMKSLGLKLHAEVAA